MALKKITYLYCDTCFESTDEDCRNEPYDFAAEPGYFGWMQREDAKKDGWTQKGGKDYCPECSSADRASL